MKNALDAIKGPAKADMPASLDPGVLSIGLEILQILFTIESLGESESQRRVLLSREDLCEAK